MGFDSPFSRQRKRKEKNMETEEKSVSKEVEGSVSPDDPLKIIDDVKADCERRVAESEAKYNSLMRRYANGQIASGEVVEKDYAKDLELKKAKLAKGEMSNLETAQTIVDIREDAMKLNMRDPFLATNPATGDKPSDFETASRVDAVLRECIELADGSDEAFNFELQKRMNDVNLPSRRR